VKELKSKLALVMGEMDKLSTIVKALSNGSPGNESPNKKRRLSSHPEPVLLNSVLEPFPIQSQPPQTNLNTELLGNDFIMPLPYKKTDRRRSSTATLDDEMLTSLFSIYDEDDECEAKKELDDIPDLTMSVQTDYVTHVDQKLVNKLRDSLAMLPRSMQELFVERLVSVIANPEAFSRQVEAVASLATSAAQEGRRRLDVYGDTNTDEQTIVLATSVLGSFLSRYGSSLKPPTTIASSNLMYSNIIPTSLYMTS